MKYENAKDILPNHLLEELQKYAAGHLIYVPAVEERRSWGENSGLREKLRKRNIMIQNKYAHGVTITELADEYYLSLDSIKKIIYSVHKNQEFVYQNTVASAVMYANAGILEEWIQSYSLFSAKTGDDLFLTESPTVLGVVKLPLRLIHTKVIIDLSVENIWDKNELENQECPPLIIVYREGKLWCKKEQEDFFVGLKQSGRNTYPAIIMIPKKEDYMKFNRSFGNVLFFMNSDDLSK